MSSWSSEDALDVLMGPLARMSTKSGLAARAHKSESVAVVAVLFFVSGIPALLYQIVWQRALFTIYGVNIESVTVVVAAFMLGLGIGSLAGRLDISTPQASDPLGFLHHGACHSSLWDGLAAALPVDGRIHVSDNEP